MEKFCTDLEDGFALATPEVWRKTILKCEELISAYWSQDITQDLTIEQAVALFFMDADESENTDGIDETSSESDDE